MSEKIQKVLAQAGVASRRKIETWIQDKRITVDGELATIGQRIDETNEVKVDGKVINWQASQQIKTRVLAYHKPIGEICTRDDPQGRRTIFKSLPAIHSGRWIAVGRLDINTSGLILVTNNGELANRLMHPSYVITRVYIVTINQKLSAEQLKQLQTGVELDDGLASFDQIKNLESFQENQFCYQVSLHEGRYREVRRMFQYFSHKVISLKRISYANVTLAKNLKKGQWQELDEKLLQSLCQLVKL